MKLWWRLVRFGFRLLYNEMAFTYDLVSKIVSLGQWRCWQRAALRHVDGKSRILELAHGTGDLHLDLYAAGYRPIGYDLSPYMGAIARRKLSRQGIDARLARGVVQRLPFAAGQFDAIICTFPTEFIFQDDTLSEARRVLANGGRFIIVINGVLTGGGLLTRSLEWLYRITGQRSDAPAHQGRFQQVEDLFTQHGFRAKLIQEPCRGGFAQVIIAEG